MYTDLSRETERRSTMKILIAVVTICCIVFHCKGIAVTLQNLTDFYGLNGNPVLMECILNAGNFNAASQRRWLRDGVTLFSNGISSSAGNGYSETFGTDRFGLQTPILDRSFNGSTYQCVYGFFQSTLYMKIAVIEGMKKSSGDCIKGISIETCSFSLSNVIPEINQQNLTVYYKDDTVEDVTSMLTVTSQVNTDGSRAYQFKIVQVPGTISMDVKILSLFFMVDIYPTTLNITMIPVGENEPSNVYGTVGIIVGVVAVVGITVVVVFIKRKKIKKEVKSKIDPQSRKDPKVKELTEKLLDWINHVLANDGITVVDIEKDLFNGQILQKLIEKLAGLKDKVSEVTQSEQGQEQKLQNIFTEINQILQKSPPRTQIKWSVDSVYSKDLVAILHLLVALANHFQATIGLPENVSVNIIVETKQCGKVDTRKVAEVINPVNEYAETRIGIPERAKEKTPFLQSGQ